MRDRLSARRAVHRGGILPRAAVSRPPRLLRVGSSAVSCARWQRGSARDMTFAQARRDRKQLFRRAGRGEFAPTVHGELFFQSTYEATKGKKKKLTEV